MFNESAFAAHAIDRLHLRRAAGDGAQKPFAPGFRFLAIPCAE